MILFLVLKLTLMLASSVPLTKSLSLLVKNPFGLSAAVSEGEDCDFIVNKADKILIDYEANDKTFIEVEPSRSILAINFPANRVEIIAYLNEEEIKKSYLCGDCRVEYHFRANENTEIELLENVVKMGIDVVVKDKENNDILFKKGNSSSGEEFKSKCLRFRFETKEKTKINLKTEKQTCLITLEGLNQYSNLKIDEENKSNLKIEDISCIFLNFTYDDKTLIGIYPDIFSCKNEALEAFNKYF